MIPALDRSIEKVFAFHGNPSFIVIFAKVCYQVLTCFHGNRTFIAIFAKVCYQVLTCFHGNPTFIVIFAKVCYQVLTCFHGNRTFIAIFAKVCYQVLTCFHGNPTFIDIFAKVYYQVLTCSNPQHSHLIYLFIYLFIIHSNIFVKYVPISLPFRFSKVIPLLNTSAAHPNLIYLTLPIICDFKSF